MFRIENGRKQFYQWDINQRLIVENETIQEVHFSNATITTAIEESVYTEDGKRVVNVPNILLQSAFDLKVYGCCSECVRYEEKFQVVARNKPADYVYYEIVGGDYKTLEKRVVALEEENDFSNYYTKAETDAAIKNNVPVIDLTGYATESYVNDKVADIDLSDYALKTDITGFTTMEAVENKGYQTAAQVEEVVNNALGVVENGYY